MNFMIICVNLNDILNIKNREFFYDDTVLLWWSSHLTIRLLCMFYPNFLYISYNTYTIYIVFVGVSSSFCMQMDFSGGWEGGLYEYMQFRNHLRGWLTAQIIAVSDRGKWGIPCYFRCSHNFISENRLYLSYRDKFSRCNANTCTWAI
jgi:hypothetical protein